MCFLRPIRSTGTVIQGVEIDEHGITPAGLASAIEAAQSKGLAAPRVLYRIPHGQVCDVEIDVPKY